MNYYHHLNNYLKVNMASPFEWGTFDCCLFAANAVKIQTGKDFAASFRGRYTTALGAQRALVKYGKGNITKTVNAMLGPMQPRLKAGRGDIAVVNTLSGDALGVLWGGKIWVASESGLTTLPLQAAFGCWEVLCQQ